MVRKILFIKKGLNNSLLEFSDHEKQKCDCCFSHIFNSLIAIENGGTSLYRGNSELIRVSLRVDWNYPVRADEEQRCLSVQQKSVI